ncbi:MAG: glutathione S-transferase family protein [Boseongicola sp. SB0677_bin_26]|nr:glutathione S-transferase family protein [Boseongicola sp. SB0677_bin_26]
MKVVSFKICPFVQRVTALLEAKGVPYDIKHINLSDKPDWFLKASPNGQVPILITDDGHVIFESEAIVEYIDEVTDPTLHPDDPVQKAQARAWANLASKNCLVQCSAQRSPDARTLADRAGRLSAAFAKIEQRLGDGPFAGAESIGMVEIAWLPLLHRTAIIKARSGHDFIEDFPCVKAWQKDILGTGLAARSVAGDFEERFAAFYLAESTYLGQLAHERDGQMCEGEAQGTVERVACCL